MKHELAFNLIGKQLEWSDADFVREFRELQMMIGYKYDSYQGFQPATRFHVSLLNWLSQFPTLEKRRTAYGFVKNRLTFISQREMHHLVSLMMPEITRRARAEVARQLDIPIYESYKNEAAIKSLKRLQRRTLYVGLSDGARMDVFRRYNEGRVSNEQVVAFSEIGDKKWKSLEDELKKSLGVEATSSETMQFDVVCLVDDFAGSGSSLIRFKDNEWKGKIAKFYEANHDRSQLAPNCRIHIHHFLASEKAKLQIELDLASFSEQHPRFRYTTSFSYVLPQDVVIGDHSEEELVELISDHYDKEIEDEHTGKDIWFGYKQCGLPLVLEHNTPNNSIALLWAQSDPDKKPLVSMKPLFARRKRHASNG